MVKKDWTRGKKYTYIISAERHTIETRICSSLSTLAEVNLILTINASISPHRRGCSRCSRNQRCKNDRGIRSKDARPARLPSALSCNRRSLQSPLNNCFLHSCLRGLGSMIRITRGTERTGAAHLLL